MMQKTSLLLTLLTAVTTLATPLGAASPTAISFKKIRLDKTFRSEGTGVGDFNGDGKLDISAGSVYYAGPDWKMVPIGAKAKQFDPHNYSDSFANFASDVNRDGRTDLIVVDFPNTPTWWFEQPATQPAEWKRHTGTPVTNNESPQLVDLDGDGQKELLLAFEPGRKMGVARPRPDGLWRMHTISEANAPGTDRYSHGLGAGDLNGDGRTDVLVVEGWWERPVEPDASPWKFHPAKLGGPCAQMYVYDFDDDGDADVLSSSAHDFGIWWHEQTADGWKTHEIDRSFSQTHSLVMADINGDGLPDFVTGKRWWAHGPKGDPGADQPAVMFWFEFSRSAGQPKWTPHKFDDDSGVGTQFEVADVNGDSLLDIATSNKKGTHLFLQERK